ncbi:ATP-binding protein [Malikia spinosa]|uniref:histidine kinase n=1 Tax=Malikia spinosa TaxID=86180 RepID=A0A7C9J5N3_9BURK|nr:ATP-binding protein [Malikia spinosa]MYZ51711.1 response regulator [Malikia spinosa]
MILVRLHRLLLALLVGWCFCSLARAQSLDLSELPPRVDLVPHLQLLLDADASLQPESALQQADWQPATLRQLSRGSTAAALWLRLDLVNSGPEPFTRWLALGNPRLERVELHRFDSEEGWLLETQRAGMAYPPSVPLARGMDAVFALTLLPGEHSHLLLRVQSRTVMTMQPQLWQPLAYLDQKLVDDLRYLLPIGVTLGLVLYLLANTLARGNQLLFLLGLWLGLGAAYDFAYYGYLRRYLLPQGSELAARLPHLLGLLSNLVLVVYMQVYLEMRRRCFWRLFFPACAILLIAFSLNTLFGDLRWSIAISALFLVLFYLVWPLALIQPWREGVPYVRAFTLLLGCVWVFTVMRIVATLGYFHTLGLAVLYAAIAFKVAMAFVLLYLVARYSVSESRHLEAMQAEWLVAQQIEQERLSQAVRSRSAALRQAAVAADEAARAKGELLARVGHDLRAPLTAIMGYAGRLEEAEGTLRQRALAIGRSAREMLALINGLLEYARIGVQPDALLPQPLYLGAFLRSVAAQASELAARHGNRFEFRLEGDLPDVVALDAKRLRQVLMQLLHNAAEFTRQGRIELLVQTRAAEQADPQALPQLIITVRDDGPGIAADQLPTLFQPFQRLGAGQSHQEVGLGLAIAHQWVVRMGGSLKASSAQDQGTTMRIWLPVEPSDETTIAIRHLMRQDSRLPELRAEGRRLWLVDDSPAVRELLLADLTGQGFIVTTLADGREALERLSAPQQQAPDLLLTDFRMPGGDGLAVLRLARARWPDLPVLLLTSAPEVLAGKEHGFSAVLAKPVSLAELRLTLARLLGLTVEGEA